MMAKAGRPHVVGLTGSIAMGKSTVARMFADLGVPVFDADAAVRILQGPGGALLPAIEGAFPGSTGAAGVDRTALGKAVFGDPQALARLEALVHPAVQEERRAFLTRHEQAPFVIFDIPLLFEKGGVADVDTVIVVSAPAPLQRQRALARPGMTEEKLAQILALQMPDADKRARADHVIETGGSLDTTRQQVRELHTALTSRLPRG